MNMQSNHLEWWREIDRPAGRRPTPDWCRDVHVNWMDGYGNSPSVMLRTVGDVFNWPGKVYRHAGGRYISESGDGRSTMYFHDGAIGMHRVMMFRGADGVIREHRRCGADWAGSGNGVITYPNGTRAGYEPGEWVEIERLATTQQDGFAGGHIHIKLEDGRDLILRGPWHVGHLAGYQEVSVAFDAPHFPRGKCKWHQRGARAGIAIRDDVFIALLSRYVPHLPLAIVQYRHSRSTFIEPFKSEWGAPKRFRSGRN